MSYNEIMIILAVMVLLLLCLNNKEYFSGTYTSDQIKKIVKAIKYVVENDKSLIEFEKITGIKDVDAVKYSKLISLYKQDLLTHETAKRIIQGKANLT